MVIFKYRVFMIVSDDLHTELFKFQLCSVPENFKPTSPTNTRTCNCSTRDKTIQARKYS